MATQNSVKVVEINEGPKIQWEQNGYKLVFGDDDLTLRCDNRQKDWPVHEDICVDDNGNLKIGMGKYYVAQVDIPARTYIDVEPEAPEDAEETEGNEDGQDPGPQREALPLDMADVTLTLWSMSDIR